MNSTDRLLIKLFDNIELLCESGNGLEAVECVKQLQPDVLVMDINMPGINGLQAKEQVKSLDLGTAVILISSDRDKSRVWQAAYAGVEGFIPKDELGRFLRPAIEAVYRGESFFVD